jgi:hypothetical protein
LIHSGIVSFDFFQKLKIKSIFAISWYSCLSLIIILEFVMSLI